MIIVFDKKFSKNPFAVSRQDICQSIISINILIKPVYNTIK